MSSPFTSENRHSDAVLKLRNWKQSKWISLRHIINFITLYETQIQIQNFSFKKKHLTKSSAKYPPLCLGFRLMAQSKTGVNSLWPRDFIWRQGSRSTLGQVMACCLTAPSHYLNQCWPMISEVLWHSPDSNFTENTEDIYRRNEFEIYLFDTVVKFPRGQWVNPLLVHWSYHSLVLNHWDDSMMKFTLIWYGPSTTQPQKQNPT